MASWRAITQATINNFEEKFAESVAKAPKETVFVEFAHPDSDLPKYFKSVLPELMRRNEEISFLRMNTSESKCLAAGIDLFIFPSYALYHRGKLVWAKGVDDMFVWDSATGSEDNLGVIFRHQGKEVKIPYPSMLTDYLHQKLSESLKNLH